MQFLDASSSGRQAVPLIIFFVIFFTTTAAQLQGRPPYQFTYQIDTLDPNNSPISPYQLLPRQQIVPQQQAVQQQQSQQQEAPPSNPSPFINPSSGAYRLDVPKTTTQQPPRENQPQQLPNPQVQSSHHVPQVQSSHHVPQEVSLQNIPFFQQPSVLNYQPFSTEQDSSFERNIPSDYTPFASPVPIPPPSQLVPNPAYSQNQNELQYDDLQQKLQLQLQITQQIQKQIEQLQKLQELNTHSITQQKKLIDEGKLDLVRGSSSQTRQPFYQQDQLNRQKLQADSQEIYTQHSLLPQSTVANLQFAPPGNALQKPQSRFVSPVFLENVTDPSLPYYLVAPSLNSVSFYNRLPNSGLDNRVFLPHTLDLTTAAPNIATGSTREVFGESVSTVTSSEVHTPTEVPNSSESTERNGFQTETATAQRRTQSELTTISPREARERLQNSIRRFVARGQQRT